MRQTGCDCRQYRAGSHQAFSLMRHIAPFHNLGLVTLVNPALLRSGYQVTRRTVPGNRVELYGVKTADHGYNTPPAIRLQTAIP
jgi:hypothetical protein